MAFRVVTSCSGVVVRPRFLHSGGNSSVTIGKPSQGLTATRTRATLAHQRIARMMFVTAVGDGLMSDAGRKSGEYSLATNDVNLAGEAVSCARKDCVLG
jgi:hypothetical protein